MNLEKLKVRIIVHQPFFGALLHKLEHRFSDKIPTVCTNGKEIIYNEAFMDSLPFEIQVSAICHELLHAAFLHLDRYSELRKFSDKESAILWNVAGDYLINHLLKHDMNMPIGDEWLFDPKYNLEEWTTEKLYWHLKKEMPKINIDGGVGCGDDMAPSKEMGEAETKRNALEWEVAINQAAQIAKQQGALPASIERLIGKLLKPKIDWKKELYDWLCSKVFVENTWNKGNRRFLHNGLYLPAKYSEGIGELIVGVDTSGSIGENELTMFSSELNYIMETVKPIKVTVVYCDASVNRVREFLPDNYPIQFEAVGGGGTDFRPVFNWVEENRTSEDIAGLIYMTDMYGSFPETPPNYPVAWMATSKTQPPFGKYIEYPFGENIA